MKVTRDTARHEIDDLNVTSQLRGDFAAAHLAGDNAHVVATDTQKNTIFAFARDGIGSPEAFLLRLADHFTGSFDWVERRAVGGRAVRVGAHPRAGDAEHDHAFVRSGQEVRTAVVVADGAERHVHRGPQGAHGAEDHRVGVRGLPEGPVHDAARDLATASSPRMSRRAGATDAARRSTTTPSYASVRTCCSRRSPRSTPQRCRRPSSTWAAACSSATPRSPRSASRCRTSTTSWSTSSPVRPRQPERGVLRRRPPLRPDRGGGAARGRREPGRGVGGHRGILLTGSSGSAADPGRPAIDAWAASR